MKLRHWLITSFCSSPCLRVLPRAAAVEHWTPTRELHCNTDSHTMCVQRCSNSRYLVFLARHSSEWKDLNSQKLRTCKCRTWCSCKTGNDFSIRLIGKQFTGAAVMLLVQKERFRSTTKSANICLTLTDMEKHHYVKLAHSYAGMGDYPDEIVLRGDYTEDQYLNFFKKPHSILLREPGGTTATLAM